MTRRTSKIVMYICIGVLGILFAAVGFTQTALFKQTLRSTIYKLVDANLNASVYIGTIHGNLFTGLSIDTVAMYVNNAPFVEASNVIVRYDPIPLWRNHFSLGIVQIERPSVSLIRFADGTWNVDRLAKKKSESDTLPSPWVIDMKNLTINNARFRLIDSTSQGHRDLPDSILKRTIDFSNLNLEKVNIALSAVISEKEQTASIKNISFAASREGFSLLKFSADLHHTSTLAEVKNLLIVTPRSHIELSAKINSVDAFKIKDLSALRFAPLECSVVSSTIAAEDLQHFLPSLNFFRGSVQCDFSAGGEFGDVKVKRLQANFDRSQINLSGSVLNLHHPKDLTLNIESKGTVIQPSDVPKLLPFFHIPDFGSAGNLALDFHYTGKPLDFQVVAHASLPAGEFSVDGGLDLTGPTMKYRSSFGGARVNAEKFFSNPSLRSHLDFSGTIEGEGTAIDDLHSTATIAIDSSSFNGIAVSRLRAVIVGENKKISLSAKVHMPKGDINFESGMDYASGGVPVYSFDGVFSHFNLASILKEERYASDCSFTLNAHASDFLREDMTGDARIIFSPSQFGSYTIDSSRADLHIQLDSLGRKLVRLVSPIADASLNGSFSYEGVIAMVESHLDGMRLAYNKQRAMFDTSFIAQASPVHQAGDPASLKVPAANNEIHYSLRLKNLEPLAIFLGTDPFNAVGSVEGTLSGNADTLSGEGSLSIRSGRYLAKNSQLLVENGSVEYDFHNMTHDSLLASVNGPNFLLHAKAATVISGESYFRNAALDLTFHNRQAEYSIQGEMDSTIKLGVDGRATMTPELYQFTFNTFSFWYQGYELDAAHRFSARMDSSGIAVDSTTFIHQDEQLVLGGFIGYRGGLDAFARLQNFSLPNIYHFGKSQDFKSSALSFGGTVNAQVSAHGTMQEPVLFGGLDISDFSYRGTAFGFVNSDIRYSNKAANFSVQLSKTPQSRDTYELLCSGSIPMDLAFASVDNRFSLPGLDMYLKAQSFDISIIDPFIAQVDEMKGTMDGSIHCVGSLDSPSFDGSMDLQNGAFLFPMNNMKYQVAGKIDFHDNKISFPAFAAKNLYEDYSSGTMQLGGYISLRGFVPDEYHLSAKGELMVLQDASRNINQGVYGDLIASTGSDGLLFDGTYTSSRLSGSLFVKQASLTFPPARQAAGPVSTRYLNVVVVDDTSKPSIDTLLGPNIFAFFRPKKNVETNDQPSFLDGLGYDLVIQTQGIVQVRMVFNAATNEELFADLNGKLGLSKEGSNVRLTGTITVSEKSNYNFYKQFAASGTLKFTGRPDNPELDIKATYTGSHVKTEVAGLKAQDPAAPPPTEKVIVSLAITGTRFDPKIKIGLSTVDDNGNETERTGDVESDAISFLLTSTPGVPGKFREDLTSNDKQGIANSLGGSIGGSLISGFTNTLLSGMTLDFLRSININAVSNVELMYTGSSPDLRLSGVVGNAYWSFGGKVFSDINNANVSLQWSLGSIVQSEGLRNIMFEVDRKTDVLETSDQRRPTNGARIYYRFAF